MDELFENNFKDKTCLTCKHRESWHGYSKYLQYCNKHKSNRTQNGMLKIKVKTKACQLYEDRRER